MSATSVSITTRAPGGAARLAAVLAALALAGGCATAPDSTPDAEQAPIAGARAESAVKLALIEATAVEAAAISVIADDGSLTLGGFVASESEREAALEAARTASGGLTVIDEMEVRD